MEEKRIAFWMGKIEAMLKAADPHQMEIIYGFAHAFLTKAGTS